MNQSFEQVILLQNRPHPCRNDCLAFHFQTMGRAQGPSIKFPKWLQVEQFHEVAGFQAAALRFLGGLFLVLAGIRDRAPACN